MELRHHRACWAWVFVTALLNNSFIRAIPIDNAVVGDPEVVCHADSTELLFESRNPFHGRIFVKGHSRDAECYRDFQHLPPQGQAVQNSIRLGFGACGVDRNRKSNPRGISVQTTIVIQFHEVFLTKVDRAYRIDCFYMEADKTVSSELEVSMITTNAIEEQFPMPVCRYSIHKDSFEGPAVRFLQVGEPVFHKWQCVSELDKDGKSPFGMLVHSCYVKDGSNEKVLLVDDTGCSMDPYILGHLSYGPDLLLAYREAHVFKFADRNQLQFSCQIRLCFQTEGMDTCRGMTPPKCQNLKNKRSLTAAAQDDFYNFDIQSHPMVVFDLDEPFPDVNDPAFQHSSNFIVPEAPHRVVCVSSVAAVVCSCLAAILVLICLTLLIAFAIKRHTSSGSSLRKRWSIEAGFVTR